HEPQAPARQEDRAPAASTADVRLVDVTKRFDDVVAVDGLSLEIERGSFFALLGPSGCGKTTTLRMIGGFEEPTEGTIYLGNRPEVLLLDEPLGALDLKLRKQMQLELKAIQHDVEITFIHVTHDQEEAMTMADRIAVMNNGHVEQLGAPTELYETPQTAFVAG